MHTAESDGSLRSWHQRSSAHSDRSKMNHTFESESCPSEAYLWVYLYFCLLDEAGRRRQCFAVKRFLASLANWNAARQAGQRREVALTLQLVSTEFLRFAGSHRSPPDIQELYYIHIEIRGNRILDRLVLEDAIDKV